jgi:Uma2 family endonuclease
MTTTHKPMTAEDLWNRPDDGNRSELVRGELRTMAPAGSEHGATIMILAAPLAQHVRSRRLGVVFGAETGFTIAHDPDTVRAPDIAFVSQSRIPSSGIPKKFFPGAPDLAVEVVSPGDTFEEVHDKVADWLAAGTRIVWVVNPKHRTVTVYKPGPQVQVLAEKDQLTGEDVVPGFACGVGEVFV